MASVARRENPPPPEPGLDPFLDHRRIRSSNSPPPLFAASSPPSSASSTTTQHSPVPSSSEEGTSSPAAPNSTATTTTAKPEPRPLSSIHVAAANSPEPLPLGWTQVKRKRKRSVESDETDPQFCCEDPDCVRPDGRSIPSSDYDAAKGESRSVANFTTLRGKAIFCLPTLSTTWYQGHFLPATASTPKPLGILAIERANVDECLRCNDGGYKELDVQVFNYVDGRRLTQRIEGPVVGTGGDMMRLRSSSVERGVGAGGRNRTARIEYDADKILTGKKAVPFVCRYFSNLLKKVRGSAPERYETEEGSDVMELLPDVAIVVGTMTLTVPTKFFAVRSEEKNDNDDDDDGLWG